MKLFGLFVALFVSLAGAVASGAGLILTGLAAWSLAFSPNLHEDLSRLGGATALLVLAHLLGRKAEALTSVVSDGA